MSDDLPSPFPGQSDKVVQVEKLSKKYKDTLAVNGISFSLSKGEVFAFLGPNGAGKTTTVGNACEPRQAARRRCLITM